MSKEELKKELARLVDDMYELEGKKWDESFEADVPLFIFWLLTREIVVLGNNPVRRYA
jgi:hypothetical protein